MSIAANQVSKIVARTSVNENVDSDIYGFEGEFVFTPLGGPFGVYSSNPAFTGLFGQTNGVEADLRNELAGSPEFSAKVGASTPGRSMAAWS